MLSPSFRTKVDFTNALSMVIPIKPYTIEGTPANSSIPPFTHILHLSDKNSETSIALPMARGREKVTDKRVTINDPYIIGNAP